MSFLTPDLPIFSPCPAGNGGGRERLGGSLAVSQTVFWGWVENCRGAAQADCSTVSLLLTFLAFRALELLLHVYGSSVGDPHKDLMRCLKRLFTSCSPP